MLPVYSFKNIFFQQKLMKFFYIICIKDVDTSCLFVKATAITQVFYLLVEHAPETFFNIPLFLNCYSTYWD